MFKKYFFGVCYECMYKYNDITRSDGVCSVSIL